MGNIKDRTLAFAASDGEMDHYSTYLLEDELLNVENIRVFAASADDFLAMRAARHSKCPESAMREILAKHPHVIGNILSNPNCPEDIIDSADWTDQRIIRTVLSTHNSVIPSRVIKKIYESIDKHDTYSIARLLKQKNCPAGILQEYAGHWNEDISEAVASNPNCPEECFTKILTKNISDQIFRKILNHPNFSLRTGINILLANNFALNEPQKNNTVLKMLFLNETLTTVPEELLDSYKLLRFARLCEVFPDVPDSTLEWAVQESGTYEEAVTMVRSV